MTDKKKAVVKQGAQMWRVDDDGIVITTVGSANEQRIKKFTPAAEDKASAHAERRSTENRCRAWLTTEGRITELRFFNEKCRLGLENMRRPDPFMTFVVDNTSAGLEKMLGRHSILHLGVEAQSCPDGAWVEGYYDFDFDEKA